jgi:crossover junction endodeoxyribonuclease RuvC
MTFNKKKITIDNILVIDSKKAKNKGHGETLHDIYISLVAELIKNERPDVFVREAAVGTFCHGTTMTLNKVVGVVDLALWEVYKEEWVEKYRPTSIKKAITGSGKASKQEVDAEIQKYLSKKMEFEGDDESDAVAVAVMWLMDNGHLPKKEEADTKKK